LYKIIAGGKKGDSMQKRNVFVDIFLFISLGCGGKDLALKIRYDRIHGLEENSRVLFDGNPIGEVTRIRLRS
jgi:ABC-type transporter Mla subunit MlaD